MNKFTRKCCALSLALIMGLSAAGCGGGESKVNGGDVGDDPVNETLDKERTQLYVFNFAGGFGAEWLTAAKTRYEKLHKDDVYEEGKKGIQIVINNSKTGADALQNQILYNKEEVYFTELAYYYTLKNAGVLGDITEAVTDDLSKYGDAAGSTIESKLTEEQKAFYGVEEDGKLHYYGIPHYAGYTSLMYNKDLFEQEKYYFADGVTKADTLEDYFIVRSTDKKSTGPDGEYGTSDDGLPATFEEFFLLCDYISAQGQTPVSWRGTSYDDYLRKLMLSIEANIEGKEQMSLNYTMNGTAEDLGKATANGFKADAGSTAVTADKGYEVFRQAGKYHTLSFINRLVTTDKYHGSLNFNSGYSHMNAQEDFLYAGNDNGQTAPIAMLVDGIWWENEAKSTFDSMVDSMGENYSKENRNFAMMPLPKLDAGSLGKNTLFDCLYSLCFMKSNVEDWKKPIAQDFIAFVNTEESLVEFTQMTNTPKALEYSMSEEQLKKLTTFGRSVFDMKQNSDIVYPFSGEAIYVNQSGSFEAGEVWASQVGNSVYYGPAAAFHEGKAGVAEYFDGMQVYNKSMWKQKVY